MLVDVLMVLAAYTALLFAGAFVYSRWPSKRRAVSEPAHSFPMLRSLLRCGQDGASLVIERPTEDRNGPQPSLKLIKYITPSGTIGLECFVSSSAEGRKLLPGHQRHGEDWPLLARFLTEHGIPMVTVTSPPGEHYSEYYFMLRLDFGTDCQAALRFANFFFRTILALPPGGFRLEQKGVRLFDRLLWRRVAFLSREQQKALQVKSRNWRPWNRLRESPRAEYEDVLGPLIQVLGLAGACYGLVAADTRWPAVHLALPDVALNIRIFDLVFMLIFVLGLVGPKIPKGPVRSRSMALTRMVVAAPMHLVFKVARLAVKLNFLASKDELAQFFAPEEPKLYGALTWLTLPNAQIARTIQMVATILGALACIAAAYRWIS